MELGISSTGSLIPKEHHGVKDCWEFGEHWYKQSVRLTHPKRGPFGERRPFGERIKVISTVDHKDKHYWITYDGKEPTDKDYAQVWPKERQKRVERHLELGDGLAVVRVVEKKGADGRRFWKELENPERDWNEWMSEEGFDIEIDRLMAKD